MYNIGIYKGRVNLTKKELGESEIIKDVTHIFNKISTIYFKGGKVIKDGKGIKYRIKIEKIGGDFHSGERCNNANW